jgi:hypothetical protein
MHLTTYEQVDPFLSKLRTELERQEVRNSLPLGVALNLQKYPTRRQPYLATVEDGTRLVAAAVMTPLGLYRVRRGDWRVLAVARSPTSRTPDFQGPHRWWIDQHSPHLI